MKRNKTAEKSSDLKNACLSGSYVRSSMVHLPEEAFYDGKNMAPRDGVCTPLMSDCKFSGIGLRSHFEIGEKKWSEKL